MKKQKSAKGKVFDQVIGWSRYSSVHAPRDKFLRKDNDLECHICYSERRVRCVRTKQCEVPSVQGTYWEDKFLKSRGVVVPKGEQVLCSLNAISRETEMRKIRQEDFKHCRCVMLQAIEMVPAK